MAINTYPASPKPYYSVPHKHEITGLLSEAESGAEEMNFIQRFGRHSFQNDYKVEVAANRKLVHDFYRANLRKFFWFLDFDSRSWADEYVGVGGPLDVHAALLKDNTVYTDYTEQANNTTVGDVQLLPTSPVVNQDGFMFGSKTQFDKITVTISTAGAGTWTITFKYWNGSAWASLSGVSDGTTHFRAAAGARDVTFTVPTDWVSCEIDGIEAYWIKADLTSYTSKTVIPLATQITVNTKTFDLHVKTGSSVAVYADGVLLTAGGVNYTLVSGGGAADADRISLTAYPAQGALITADFTGQLRIKARFAEFGWSEQSVAHQKYEFSTSIKEIQW